MEETEHQYQLIESSGPWPFITQKVFKKKDHPTLLWLSRHHRKQLIVERASKATAIGKVLTRSLWQPEKLNWWIGVVFALGSSFFMLGSLFILCPAFAEYCSLGEKGINTTFFIGSIPFTTAAYLQLFQAANVDDPLKNSPSLRKRSQLVSWRPSDIGWLSCFLQFIGTICFNFNTFDAMIPGLNWFQQDLLIWIPNWLGSILFLTSGYLAFIETCHQHFAWRPKSISWWTTLINLFGCLGFMASAVFAFSLPQEPGIDILKISVFFTLLGAIGFLFGALLLLPETTEIQPSKN
jgi:hypothetical protein